MVVSLKANRKRIVAFLILAAVVIGACIFLKGGDDPGPAEAVPGGTNEERIAYLESFGWSVESEPAQTREVMIPAQFDDVYTAYNVMQQAQGFDLKPYAGEVCTQYQYKINNYPGEEEVYATLLVVGEKIVGGDVACSKLDGFMHGFARDSVAYGETPGQSGSEKGTASAVPDPVSSCPAGPSESADPTVPAESAAAADASTESTVETDTVPEDAYPTD